VLRARARSERGGPPLFATFALSVSTRDVTNIDLTLRPGAVVRGEIAIDARHGHAPPAYAALRVRAPLPNGSSFGDAQGAAVQRDGTFTLDGLMAGTHVLMLQGLVFPWRITEARVLGQDAVERVFDVEARQQVTGVRVVLADVAAGVAGRVTLPPGTDSATVLVVAFPADPLRRALPLRFVRVGRLAPDGSYRVVDLAASDYRVAALVGATEQDALDPEMLERWMPMAAAVTLQETEIATVALTAVPSGVVPSVP
jgi:hypothetical protein